MYGYGNRRGANQPVGGRRGNEHYNSGNNNSGYPNASQQGRHNDWEWQEDDNQYQGRQHYTQRQPYGAPSRSLDEFNHRIESGQHYSYDQQFPARSKGAGKSRAGLGKGAPSWDVPSRKPSGGLTRYGDVMVAPSGHQKRKRDTPKLGVQPNGLLEYLPDSLQRADSSAAKAAKIAKHDAPVEDADDDTPLDDAEVEQWKISQEEAKAKQEEAEQNAKLEEAKKEDEKQEIVELTEEELFHKMLLEECDLATMTTEGSVAPVQKNTSLTVVDVVGGDAPVSKADTRPSGWEEFEDKDSGEKFYHHRGLCKTQWDKPSKEQVKEASKVVSKLPIEDHKKHIVDSVKKNRVTIISGETGSGKTTQAPQYFLDDPELCPANKRIIVTQPRRIAAITNSERVCQERGLYEVGKEVGYQIRFGNRTTAETRLIYCTTAVVLRKLHEDASMGICSVLVVDEVHERDIHTEFLLTTVKENIKNGKMPHLRLVLMTATFAESSFVPFFEGLLGNPPIIKISGRCFPVKEWFLEDALAWTGSYFGDDKKRQGVQSKMIDETQERLKLANPQNREYDDDVMTSLCLNRDKDIDLDKQRLLCQVISMIDSAAVEKGDESRGAVLIFLPGWKDIMNLGVTLRESENNEMVEMGHGELRKYHIVPLHGQLSPEEQHLVFDPSPPNRRKVILSTDIAETSVTIDDVVYVINAGITKDKVFDVNLNTGILESQLNTVTSATQRKGRAGRTREGVCLHLFPKYMLTTLREFPDPAILSTSLEEVVLQQMCLDLGQGPHDFLSKTISVPPVERIDNAVECLQQLNALRWEDNASAPTLTPLGRWLGGIPQHPCVSVMMTYAALFGVLLPATILSAFLGAKWPFSIIDKPAANCGKVGLGKDKQSDHAAVVTAFLDYKKLLAPGFDPANKHTARIAGEAYLEKHKLSKEQIDMADQHVRSFLTFMAQHGYQSVDISYKALCLGSWPTEVCFDETRLLLFKAALCGGYQPNFSVIKQGKYYMSNDEEVVINNNSCNKGYRTIDDVTEFVMWTDMMAFGKVSMNDTTVVGAAYVVLFSRTFETFPDHPGWFSFDRWEAYAPPEVVDEIVELRNVLKRMLDSAVFQQQFREPRSADLDPIVEFLKKPLKLNSVKGLREKKKSEKETRTLFVKNFGDASAYELQQFLTAQHGFIVNDVTLPTDYHTGASKGFAFIELQDRAQAEECAASLHNSYMGERKLHVELKVPNEDPTQASAATQQQ